MKRYIVAMSIVLILVGTWRIAPAQKSGANLQLLAQIAGQSPTTLRRPVMRFHPAITTLIDGQLTALYKAKAETQSDIYFAGSFDAEWLLPVVDENDTQKGYTMIPASAVVTENTTILAEIVAQIAALEAYKQ